MKQLLSIPARIYLIALVGIGTFLRFWEIAKSSIWHDEGYTMMLAPMSPGEIIMRTGRDVHPPLYYLALHYWLQLFGSSETAARSLSAICMIAIIPLAYVLVKRLWDERAARFAALFVTIGPFLIRYSQEARMYGMVAFLLLAATYCLIRALASKGWGWWIAYAVVLAAALYTHYYSVFMIVVHWIYVASQTSRKRHSGLWNLRWWASNVLAATLFLPWVPVALKQFMRVQGSFWIPPVNITTLPNTLLEFMAYGQGDFISTTVKVLIGLVFVGVVALTAVKASKHRRATLLLSAYALLGPALVVLLSYKRPIYVDRYFVFAAVGFYCLLAVMVSLLNNRLAAAATVVVIALAGLGVYNVQVAANHKMRDIGAYVTSHYQTGDEIVSGELYTFFDFSYYNHTGVQTKLWSKNGVNGYGESSLIYDRSDEIIVKRLEDIHPASGKLWMVGKTGAKDYYDHVPPSWVPVGAKVTAGGSAVQEYLVPPRSLQRVAVQ